MVWTNFYTAYQCADLIGKRIAPLIAEERVRSLEEFNVGEPPARGFPLPARESVADGSDELDLLADERASLARSHTSKASASGRLLC